MLQCIETLFSYRLLMINEPLSLWTPGLSLLQVSTHSLIVLFYYSISILVIYVLYQHRSGLYTGILMLLGAFTLASGTSHLMEVWALLHPTHWLTNGIEAIAVVMDLLTVLLAALLLLNVILDFNKDSEGVATSGESALPWEAKTLSATQTHQLDAELEQQVNEQIAALQRNHPQFKSELHGRVRWLEELGLLQSLCALISEADDFQSALCVALRLVCEVTNWDYGEAWLPSADNSVLECTPAWYSKTTRLEQFRLSREKLILPRNTALPGRVWTSRRPEWIEDISALADTSVVRPQARFAGLKAAFGVPILIGDRVLAVLAFFITQSRAEDEQLVELVSAVATQLGLVIQRKQLEEELRQEKDFSKTLIETSSAFFVVVDAQGRMIMMNQAFLEAVGYTLDEVLGADYLLTFAPRRDRKSIYKTFKQLIKSRQSIL